MINLFKKKSIGIDISDNTIEIVELGKNQKVLNHSRIILNPGIVQGGRIKDRRKLAVAVKKVFSEAEPNSIVPGKVIFGLPESQVYIRLLKLGPHNRKERKEIVLKEIYSNIPLSKNSLFYSYRVVNEDENSAEILIIAADKRIVGEWQTFFNNMGIEVKIFDIESLAIYRGLFTKPIKESICIVDIGSATTNVSIFNKNNLYYSHSINSAGNDFTNQIAESLKISFAKAEGLKIDKGLADKEGKVYQILVGSLESMVKEIKSLINYYENRTGENVKEIILVGGSSKLKNITDYFSTNLSLLVKIGQSIVSKAPLEYVQAVGLALRGLDRKWKKDTEIKMLKTGFKKPKKIIIGKPVKSIKETGLDLIHKKGNEKKTKFQKILLISIIVFGLVIISLAFLYRIGEKTKRAEETEIKIVQYTKTQLFDFKISIAVDSSEYADNIVKARIIEDIIDSAEDYNEAVVNSRMKVEKDIKDTEELWAVPINEEQDSFPMTIKWVVYFKDDINGLFSNEIDKINVDNVDYVLNNIQKKELIPTDNLNVFYLSADVTISLDNLIVIERYEDDVEEIEETDSKVLIKETPTGWLRVREKPGTSYQEIAKVIPGEKYILLEENKGWFKIQVDEKIQGWVSSLYANKVDN